MRPLVGITQCLDDRGRWRAERETLYLDRAYASAVEAAGGLPVHVPLQDDADDVIRRLDGLVVPGGDDFPPPEGRDYDADATFDPAPPEQISFDARLVDAALGRGLPLLGICYGMQLLALRCGGSLHYHLPADVPASLCHRAESGPAARHEVRTTPGTWIADVLGERAIVNSRHHQAVATPGRRLRVSARSTDGVIEAIEGDACLGVQWHPETSKGPGGRGPFDWLLSRCRGSAD